MSGAASFYVTGGTLRLDAPSYVARRGDTDLYDSLTRGEYCYVLTARRSCLSMRPAGASASMPRGSRCPAPPPGALPRTVLVGLVITSTEGSRIAEAKFRDLEVRRTKN